MTASGFCRFHFWGNYNQSFFLKFPSADMAASAADLLNRTQMTERVRMCGSERILPIAKWQHCQDPKFIGIMVTGRDVDTLRTMMVSMGADRKKIGSMANSCDHGEPFEIQMELESKNQMKLDL